MNRSPWPTSLAARPPLPRGATAKGRRRQPRPSHHDRRRSQSPPRPQMLSSRHDHSYPLEVGAVSFLATRLLIGRGTVVAFGTLASHWLGCTCDARPSLIGWRKRPMPFLGAEPRSEAMEAPPKPSAKNTWAMVTGLSRGRCYCRRNKPDYKITHSAHTKFP